jgi:phenylalanyl-tRNA synthetase beta chain
VTIKADLIEEITRIYGYDNFEIKTTRSPLLPVRRTAANSNDNRAKDILVSTYALHEVHSYIWSDKKKNDELGIKTPDNVKVINAQTPDHTSIRVSMIPTLLSFVKENRGYADTFGIFEIGHTVDGYLENGYCKEEKKLGVALFSRENGEEELFLSATDAVRELCEDILHKSPSFRQREGGYDFEHPKNSFDILLDGGVIGFLSVPHPVVSDNIDKKGAVAFFEIYTEAFAENKAGTTKYLEPSKFPEIEIDMTFVAEIGAIDFEALCELAKNNSDGLLSSVVVKDIYSAEGETSITLRFSFASKERTLSKQELAPVTEKIAQALAGVGINLK